MGLQSSSRVYLYLYILQFHIFVMNENDPPPFQHSLQLLDLGQVYKDLYEQTLINNLALPLYDWFTFLIFRKKKPEESLLAHTQITNRKVKRYLCSYTYKMSCYFLLHINESQTSLIPPLIFAFL